MRKPEITSATRLFGVVGHPVAHSLSPVMMNAAFAHIGFDAVYLAFDVERAEDIIHAARALNMGGLSVTIPHKESVIALLDEVGEDARDIGAVNTIVNREGRLIGRNTDWLGCINAIEETHDFAGELPFMVLGSGGAARAAAWGLAKAGLKVIVAARSEEKARAVAEPLGGDFISLDKAPEVEVEGIVNATPVGMAPDTEAIPIAPRAIREGMVVLDTVYSPVRTRLLREAAARGAIVVSGLKMLLYQAVGQVELWTGREAPAITMEEALKTRLKKGGDQNA